MKNTEKNTAKKPFFARIGDVIGSFFGHLFYILSLVWETKKGMLFLLAFLCTLDGVLPVAGAYISAAILDDLSEAYTAAGAGVAMDFTPILLLLLFLFVYQFLAKIINRVSQMSMRIAGDLVANHIRMKILHKVKEVDHASFDRPAFYEKLENANREAGHRPVSILTSAFNIISASVSVASFIAILVALHPLAPLLILVMALPGAAINYVYRRKTFEYMWRRSKDRRQMEYYAGVMTNKDMFKEIRLHDLSDTFIDKYEGVFTRYFKGIKRLVLHEGFWHIGVALATTLANAVLFVYIAYAVTQGQMRLGDYSLYTGALTSIVSYVNTLVTSTASVYEGTLFIDNVITFMNEKKTVTAAATPAVIPERGHHTIEFSHVSFAYPGTDRLVLDDISFKLQSGDIAVLVGLNGAGKTTLIKLLTRLYDPTSGVILLDGRDIRDYEPEALYRLFGILFQDFGKYAVSAKENIAFGDTARPIDDAAVACVAEESGAAAFIRDLPDGYDTPLSRLFEENGVEPSIGQWQKLSIARAFYKDSDILILDEPTASLDPLAEAEVFSQFARLGENRLTVFVSHRLSSATMANVILVLENGKLVECGNHEALMKLEGKYHNLFQTQASRYVTKDGENE